MTSRITELRCRANPAVDSMIAFGIGGLVASYIGLALIGPECLRTCAVLQVAGFTLSLMWMTEPLWRPSWTPGTEDQ